jgi:hypothetical protein
MTKEEFLQQLAQELAPVNEAERARALDYFREMILDGVENGEDEQALIESFGPPKEIAAQIFKETNTSPFGGMAGTAPIYQAKGPVQKVIVQSRSTPVDLIPTNGGTIQVHFVPRENDDVECFEENGVFSFCHRVRFFSFQNLFSAPRRITVEVPVDFAGELDICTSNTQMNISGFTHLAAAQFTTSNAHLSISGITCGNLAAHTSNGSVTLQNLCGDVCHIETANGSIRAERCAFSSGLALHTQNAGIRANDIVSDAIEYSTSNGSVCSVIVGDMREYAIRSHTSNASNTLPPELIYPEQHKHLDVSTSNGRIDVHFTTAW